MAALDDAWLSEAGREGRFIFSTADLSTEVTADTAQGIYLPPDSDATGASGAWVRQYDVLKPEYFGAVGDGSTDDALAILKAVEMAADDVLHFSRDYAVSSDTLGLNGINVSSNTRLQGEEGATIRVTGTAQCRLFQSSAQSNISYRGLTLIGNGVNGSATDICGAILFDNADATQSTGGLTIEGCNLSGFGGDAIIRVARAPSADFDLENIRIRNNTLTSSLMRDPTVSGVIASAIYVTAPHIVSGTSIISDVWIDDNRIDASLIKQGITVISNTSNRVNIQDVFIRGNIIDGAGMISGVEYGYGVSVYGLNKNVTVADNKITNSRHAGIYSVFSLSVSISNNTIDGQIDNTNNSLARGGIAVTTSKALLVDGNRVSNCLNGINANSGASPSESATPEFGLSSARGGKITNNIVSDCSVVGVSTNARDEPMTVTGNSVDCPSAPTGISIVVGTLTSDFEVEIINNPLIRGVTGLSIHITNGVDYIKRLNISGNHIQSTANGVHLACSLANNVSISSNYCRGDGTSGSYGIRTTSLNEMILSNNTVDNYATGYRPTASAGSIQSNSALRCPRVVHAAPNIPGHVAPTSGNFSAGTKIQKFNLVAGGSEGWSTLNEGTLGTLNGGSTTGGITNTETELTVNSAAGLTVGSRITIAGVTGVKRVTAIDGTTITIHEAADATVAAAACAFQAPTVKEYGAIAA